MEGFEEEHVRAAGNERAEGVAIGVLELLPGDLAEGDELGSGAEGTGHEAATDLGGFGGLASRDCALDGGLADFGDEFGDIVFGEHDAGGSESVGFDNVATGIIVGAVNGGDDLGASEVEDFVAAIEGLTVHAEGGSGGLGWPRMSGGEGEVVEGQIGVLELGAHRAIPNQDTLFESMDKFGTIPAHRVKERVPANRLVH